MEFWDWDMESKETSKRKSKEASKMKWSRTLFLMGIALSLVLVGAKNALAQFSATPATATITVTVAAAGTSDGQTITLTYGVALAATATDATPVAPDGVDAYLTNAAGTARYSRQITTPFGDSLFATPSGATPDAVGEDFVGTFNGWTLKIKNNGTATRTVTITWDDAGDTATAATVIGEIKLAAAGNVRSARGLVLMGDSGSTRKDLSAVSAATTQISTTIAAGVTKTYHIVVEAFRLAYTLTANKWHLFSFPANTVPGTVTFDATTTSIYGANGGYNALKSMAVSDTAYPYDTTLGIYPATPLTTWDSTSTSLPAVSKGFWMKAKSSVTSPTLYFDVDDPALDSAPPGTLDATAVAVGWNLIGAPAHVVGTTGLTASDLDDVALVGPVVSFTRTATTMSFTTLAAADMLTQGAGYWVLGSTGVALPVDLSQEAVGVANQAAPGFDIFNPIPKADWMLPLALDLPDGSSLMVELGVGRNADMSFDRFDVPQPPTPFEASFYVPIDHVAQRLTRSIIPVGMDGAEWPVTARIPEGGGTLQWDRAALPTGYRLRLEVNGRTVDMSRSRSLSLPGGVHNMRVWMKYAPPVTATRLLTNFPNPFNPETWIPFELAESADVSIRIFDTAGSLVRTLNIGRLEPGAYTDRTRSAYWDGMNAVGERVASGVYFYELSAGSYRARRQMVILK